MAEQKTPEAQEKHDQMASKMCPELSNGPGRYVLCKVTKCAWWDATRECCGMLPYKEVVISGGINTHAY